MGHRAARAFVVGAVGLWVVASADSELRTAHLRVVVTPQVVAPYDWAAISIVGASDATAVQARLVGASGVTGRLLPWIELRLHGDEWESRLPQPVLAGIYPIVIRTRPNLLTQQPALRPTSACTGPGPRRTLCSRRQDKSPRPGCVTKPEERLMQYGTGPQPRSTTGSWRYTAYSWSRTACRTDPRRRIVWVPGSPRSAKASTVAGAYSRSVCTHLRCGTRAGRHENRDSRLGQRPHARKRSSELPPPARECGGRRRRSTRTSSRRGSRSSRRRRCAGRARTGRRRCRCRRGRARRRRRGRRAASWSRETGDAVAPLRIGRVRQRDADLRVRPHDETRAVEAAGRGAAPDVRRAELRHRHADDAAVGRRRSDDRVGARRDRGDADDRVGGLLPARRDAAAASRACAAARHLQLAAPARRRSAARSGP